MTDFWKRAKLFADGDNGRARQEYAIVAEVDGKLVDTGILYIAERKDHKSPFTQTFYRNGLCFNDDFDAAVKDWRDKIPIEGLKEVPAGRATPSPGLTCPTCGLPATPASDVTGLHPDCEPPRKH